jgi:arylsulfatase A-like enzyme
VLNRFRVTAGAVGAVLAAGALTQTAVDTPGLADSAISSAPQSRPNILMLTADDASVGDLRFMPYTRQLLARQGTTFSNALAPTPTCVPARASMLTGQYAHNHGARTIHGPYGGFDAFDDAETLPVWLQRAGYDTIFLGKYLNGYGDNGKAPVPPGWTDWNATVGATTYRYFRPSISDNGDVTAYARYSTDLFSDLTVDVLDDPTRAERPWYMWVNYVAPHVGRPFGTDDPMKRHPKSPDAHRVETPAPARRHNNQFRRLDLPKWPDLFEQAAPDSPGSPWTRRGKRMVREGYQQRIESLQAVDEAVARAVATLRKTGQLANTIVIFNSDNGFATGQHNLYGKLYPTNEILRVPMVMRGPGILRGERVRTAVTLPDVATTIAGLAGAVPTRPQDGVDFLPWLRRGYRERVIPIEGYPVHDGRRRLYSGVRVGPWVYARYAHGEELYNHVSDPYELTNLVGEQRFSGELARMRQLTRRYEDCEGKSCPKALTRPEPAPVT